MDTVLNDTSYGLITWQYVSFIILVFWVICLIDTIRSSFENNNKIIWVLVVFFLPFLGSILYLSIGVKLKLKQR